MALSKTTLTLTDVQTALGLGATTGLVACFADACTNNFNPTYEGSKDRLSNFRGYTSFEFGNALDFDGSDDFVDFPTLTLTGNSTISFWYKPASFGGVILSSPTAGGASYIKTNSSTVVAIAINGAGGTRTVPTMSTSNWYHFMITNNGGLNFRLYLNGVDEGSNGVTSGDWEIGLLGKRWDSTLYADGIIDELAMWTSTIGTAQDASDLYNGGVGDLPSDVIASPDRYYKLNSTSGTTAIDEIDSSDGTLNNFTGTWWVAH
jgi:hypothetical protein